MSRPIETYPRTGTLPTAEPRPAAALPAGLMRLTAIGYWILFWGMNGLDKFLNRTDLGLFAWYGKDRSEQFASYFDRLGLSPEGIAPLVSFAGIWELVVAGVLVAALLPGARAAGQLLAWGFALSAATLLAFSDFDVIAGDRAELREHGLYLILLLVSWAIVTGWPRARD